MSKIKAEDARLSVSIHNKQLTIRIGIDTLAFADTARTNTVITDSMEYAKDFVRALEREDDDGTSSLTRFLDKIAEDVYEDGSIAIDYEKSESNKYGRWRKCENNKIW